MTDASSPESPFDSPGAGATPQTPPPGHYESLSSSGAPTQPAPKAGGKKGLVLGGVAALAVVGVASAAFAWTAFNGGGEHPYEHLADGAFAYAQTNVNPSASQKLAIRDLAGKFPEAGNDVRDVLAAKDLNGALFAAGMDSDKKYEFMGDRLAVAAYPDKNDDGEPELALIAQVEDEKAAESGLKDLIAWSKKDGTPMKGEVKDGYLMATTWSPAKVFNTDSSLADDEKFSEAMDDVQDNAFSGWGDMKGLADQSKGLGSSMGASPEAKTPEVEGTLSIGLKARKDGLDLETYSEGVKVNGKALTTTGDVGATATLLNQNSYDDALVSIGIAGLGDLVQSGLESSGVKAEDSGLGISNADVPKLLGDSASLSVSYDGGKPTGRLVLEGVDKATIERALADSGLTVDQVRQELSRSANAEADVRLTDGMLMVTVGAEPDGNGEFMAGTVTGEVNLDKLQAIVDPAAAGRQGKGYGKITFNAQTQDNGDGKSVVSWTTNR